MIALLFFVIFIALSAVFSGTEMAYISRDRVSHMARMRGRMGLFYGTMPREVMATILLCNNLVNVGATVSATHLFLDFWGRIESATLATAMSTLSILILGEITPKAIARSHPERLMTIFGPTIWWIWRVMRPIVAGILRMIRIDLRVSPKSEVSELLERMLSEGRITEKEARIAKRGLSLSEMTLSEACDRDFRIFRDETEARAAMREGATFTPVLITGDDIFILDVRAVFIDKPSALIRLQKLNESARVASAISEMKRGDLVAVVNAKGDLVGLLTPQSLMTRVVS
ncbi:MAG: CNNM domain-containing protein [candidate division WOR-3 bacterium]